MAWQPNREELAWAAGFFDGEGYIGPARSKRWTGVTLTVVQACTNPEEPNDEPPHALTRFRNAFGVELRMRYRGPTTPTGKHRWDLQVNRRELVQHVVAAMWPWLGPVKRRQVISAFETRLADNQVWPRTHCKRGHAFDEANTAIRHRNGRTVRECRTCSRAKSNAHRRRKRAEARAARSAS